MNKFQTGKAKLVKPLAVLLILAAFGLAAAGMAFAQGQQQDPMICGAFDDHGNCTEFVDNPYFTGD